MKLIASLSWRNLWRNKLRSALVICSIALGIWAGVFVMAFSFGMNAQRNRDAINTRLSHLQIHRPEYLVNPTVTDTLTNIRRLQEVLGELSGLEHTERTVMQALLTTPRTTRGIQLMGVDPESELRVTDIHTKIDTGTYLSGSGQTELLIGEDLAEKLHLRLRSKVVISFQGLHGEIVSAAFRVSGIYNTNNSRFDELTVFVNRSSLSHIMGGPAIHEAAVLLHHPAQQDSLQQLLQAEFPEAKVRSWKQVAPDLGYSDDVMAESMYIFVGIILLALAFGMVNTMLMAVLERKRELGMLMSLGFNKRKTFGMIVMESCYTALVGGPLGLLMAWGSVSWFSKRGIDLSVISAGLEEYGMSTVIYPLLETEFYWHVALMVIVTAFLAALYPARKALKLNPVQALRSL